MIHLFTDFGFGGPYRGETMAAIHRLAPRMPVVDLMHDAPDRDPRRAAYLLAALARRLQAGEGVVAVVDPGVGGARRALAAEIDGVIYTGPDNGLLEIVLRRSRRARLWRIDWRAEDLSHTFHGRDLFAPAAVRLLTGRHDGLTALDPHDRVGRDWPDDLDEVIHIDGYGNGITGMRAACLAPEDGLSADDRDFPRRDTFADAVPGGRLAYVNSHGLMTIAVNGGDIRRCGLSVGSGVIAYRQAVSRPAPGTQTAHGSGAVENRR